MENIKFALKGLFRKKLRTSLTILSIAFGTFSVIFINIISTAGKNAVNTELDSLGINGITICGGEYKEDCALNNSDIKSIKNIDFVEDAMPIITTVGRLSLNGQTPESVVLWGIDNGAEQMISVTLVSGEMFSENNIKNNENVCLLDIESSKKMFNQGNALGEKISILVNGETEEFTVIGLVNTKSGIMKNISGEYIPEIVYMPYTTVQNVNKTKNFVNQIAVKLDEEASMNVDDSCLEIIQTLNKNGDGVTFQNLTDQREKFMGLMDIVTVSLTGVGGISLLVACIGIMSVMVSSVSERSREIGIKMSIGAGKKEIIKEFLLDSVLLTVIGNVFGLAALSIALPFAEKLLSMQLYLTLDIIFISFVLSLLLGVIFGVYPALSAASLRPVDALKR